MVGPEPFPDCLGDCIGREDPLIYTCIKRDLYQRPYVDKLLAEPEAHFTRIQGSKLWHLALLELWLQLNVD